MTILCLPAYTPVETISGAAMSAALQRGYSKASFRRVFLIPTPSRGLSQAEREAFMASGRRRVSTDGLSEMHYYRIFREGKNPALRVLRYLCIHAAQLWKTFKHGKDTDLVMVVSTPPTQGMVAAIIKRIKRVPFVYNLQDIFPDSLVTAGLTRKGSLLWRIGRWIEDFTYRNADRIIVISGDFKQNLVSKGVPERKIEVIPNWVDTDELRRVPKSENRLFDEFGLNREAFHVVYAGNLGAGHGVEVIVDAAELLRDRRDIEFVIVGDGVCEADIRERIRVKGLSNTCMRPFQARERIPEVYSLGDVALITNRRGARMSSMPSKTWTIMATETPVICAFDLESELCSIIRSAGCGLCVEPEDPQALAAAILTAQERRKELAAWGRNARAYVLEHASHEVCPAKYVEVLQAAYDEYYRGRQSPGQPREARSACSGSEMKTRD